MKTIGVLGIAPQATIDLEVRIHRLAQSRVPAHANSGYPPMVVYHHRRPPVRLGEDGEPVAPLQVDPELLAAARWLGEQVDFVVIAANSPHIFAAEIEAAAGCSLLSMIDVTVQEVLRRRWKRVGVLGFLHSDCPYYTRPLAGHDIACETIGGELQTALDVAIVRVMEGRETEDSRDAARAAVSDLTARNVDGVVLGCTEIPLLLELRSSTHDLVSPLEFLADAAVDFAIG